MPPRPVSSGARYVQTRRAPGRAAAESAAARFYIWKYTADKVYERPITGIGIRGMRTLQMTLREVRNVTKKGITINTFMLDDSVFLSSFVSRMTALNKGRVFYADASNLGKYVLHDYVSKKKKLID